MKKRSSRTPNDDGDGASSTGEMNANRPPWTPPEGMTIQAVFSTQSVPSPPPNDVDGLRRAAEVHTRRAATFGDDDPRSRYDRFQSQLYAEAANALDLSAGRFTETSDSSPTILADGPVRPDGFRLDGVLITGLRDDELQLLQLALEKQQEGATVEEITDLVEFKHWTRDRIDKLLCNLKKKFQIAECQRVLRWANKHLVFREPRSMK